MPTKIIASVKLEGGALLSEKNAHRIVARSTRPSDRQGNRLPASHTGPVYQQEWRIQKEPKGFIFREVTHHGGICGHHPNVRALVIATLCGLSDSIEVFVED